MFEHYKPPKISLSYKQLKKKSNHTKNKKHVQALQFDTYFTEQKIK